MQITNEQISAACQSGVALINGTDATKCGLDNLMVLRVILNKLAVGQVVLAEPAQKSEQEQEKPASRRRRRASA